MDKLFGIKFEQGVRLLCKMMPLAEEISKPTLFHCIRVGVYLFDNNYSEDVIMAGLLHDILEDSDFTETELTEAFNINVTRLVMANTKDKTILSQDERIIELINRCIQNGEDSLIVKAADILDNYGYFQSVSSPKGIEYCEKNAKVLLENLPVGFEDKIFVEMKTAFQKE